MGRNYPRRKVRGFRSGMESRISKELEALGVSFSYEKEKITYIQPEKRRSYTPDFVLSNGIYIETKGYFEQDDMRKHKLIQDQHPELDIRFVFQNPNNKVRKGSQLTYGGWCEKYGFKYAKGSIPKEWIEE